MIHDLRIGATLFGFLDPSPATELVELRSELFEEVSHFHHYMELRRLVDMVPPTVLRRTPAQVSQAYAAGWRDQLDLDGAHTGEVRPGT